MLRFYTKFTVILFPLFLLLTIGVILVGRWQHGEILIYNAREPNSLNISIMLLDIPHRLPLRLTTFLASDISPANPRPDGLTEFLVCNNVDCDIWLWDGQNFTNITVTINMSEDFAAWLPDGQLAYRACVRGCEIWIWDGQSTYNLTNTPTLNEGQLIASGDGRLAYSACVMIDCDIWIWDGQTTYNLTDTLIINESNPRWSSDGRLAYLACEGGQSLCTLRLWDGQTFLDLTDSRAIFRWFSWSTDGQLTYPRCNGDNCDIWLWDGQTSQNLTQTSNFNEGLPLWNSNGEFAYVVCDVNSSCAIWWWDGEAISALTNTSLRPTTPVWSDAGQLAYVLCDNSARGCDLWLWDRTQTIRLTNTQNLSETYPVWLP
jgi:Tol biopolymer transport system component